jgi:prepilin-type N-terminal cleavage/methylation domain-containing protein
MTAVRRAVRKGFTLVELLLVITIILLISTLFLGLSTGDGGGLPKGYLDALRRAQELDDRNAAVARLGQAGEQFAEVASRGVYKASPLAPMPSEVSKEEKRRAAVAEYLKQQRDEASSAADNRLKLAHANYYETPKPVAAPKPGLTQEQFDAREAAKLEETRANTERLRRPPAPRGSGAAKPTKPTRDFIAERTAEYERRLNEGVPAGWELQPGAQPTQKQREDAAKIVVSQQMVNESIGAIRNLLAQPGAVANPATRDLLAQQGQFVQTQLRVLEDLGVPSGPDAKILGTLIGDPESIKGEVFDTTQNKLDALGKYVGNRVNATTSTYGLRRKAETPELPSDKQKRLEELRAKKAAGTLGGK